MEQVLTDGSACKAKIIESISKAKSTIKVAMAFFTDKEIADQLIAAKHKGVDVNVILSNADINNDIIDRIKDEVSLIIFELNGSGIMHHKFCIIDNSLLLQGTYNYTYNATKNNKESLNITDSSNQIASYSEIFEELTNDANMMNPNLQEEPSSSSAKEDNYLEDFTEQLRNHIGQMFDDFNYNEIVEAGKRLAEENGGVESVFVTYLDSSLASVNRNLSQEDHTKTLVKTKMTASLQKAIELNTTAVESDLNLINDKYDGKRLNIQERIDRLKNRVEEKQKEYNTVNADVSRVKADIIELNDEIDNLDRQILVRRFWTFPTVLKLLLTIIFTLYLSIFFSSAIWKIFFEEAEVLKLLSRGITPEAPPIFDANALVKIFSTKGVIYGAIAALFFVIPVLVSNIKLFTKSKVVDIVFGWVVGIILIDVIVAIRVSQHTFKIEQLKNGSDAVWTLSNAIGTGDFWMIFLFGALPLFLTKILIQDLWKAYNKSNPESVDREKTLLRKSKRRKLLEKERELDEISVKLNTLGSAIEEFKTSITKKEEEKSDINIDRNNKITEIKERVEERNRNLKEVYNLYISSVDSGNKQFLKDVINGRVSAFKTGYYNFLNNYFSSSVAAGKIEGLETAHNKWLQKNFE